MDLSASAMPALDAARSLEPALYSIGGRAPRGAVRPATREEAAEVLRAATRDGLAVVPWGGGVSLPHEAPPPRYDLALDLTALDRVVEYEPADLTLTAECGATLASLRETLAARGQELPLEGGHSGRATLGGVLAANASGPRRRRFGAPRDRVLGARYLLGDGTMARTGGKVVKNVAGYGLHRILCGSRGGLAVILEASLKLVPAPAARAALIYGCDASALRDRARFSAYLRLEPAAACVLSADLARAAGLDPHRATHVSVVGLEDDAPWIAEQEREVRRTLGAPLARLEGAEVAALWPRLADVEETPGPRLEFTTADESPTAISPLLARVTQSRYVYRAAAGRLIVWPPESEAAAIVELLAETGFTLIDARGVALPEPAAPPQVAVRALRERLREAIDPAGRFAYGERWVEGFR